MYYVIIRPDELALSCLCVSGLVSEVVVNSNEW